jgi:hypothetical protein
VVRPKGAPDAEVVLRRELRLLAGHVRDWSVRRWAAAAGPGTTRAQRMVTLIAALAEFGREAGSGAPADAVPPQVAPYALADQLTVLADDLLAAMARRPGQSELAVRALSAVLSARRDLDGTRAPNDARRLLGGRC